MSKDQSAWLAELDSEANVIATDAFSQNYDALPAIKALIRKAIEHASARPTLTLSDERIDDIQEAAYRELVAQGYNGGMGGLTWDRASARAIEAALLAEAALVPAPAGVKPSEKGGA